MKRLLILLCILGLANASLVLNQVPAIGTNVSLNGTITANKLVAGSGGIFGGSSGSLFVSSNGNVGIGTVLPSAKLDIILGNASSTTSQNTIFVGSQSAVDGDAVGTWFPQANAYNTGNGAGIMAQHVSVAAGFRKTNLAFYSCDQAFNGGFPKEQVRILGNGNVGIGLTNPVAKLDVSGTVSASALNVNGKTTINQTDTAVANLALYKSSDFTYPVTLLNIIGSAGAANSGGKIYMGEGTYASSIRGIRKGSLTSSKMIFAANTGGGNTETDVLSIETSIISASTQINAAAGLSTNELIVNGPGTFTGAVQMNSNLTVNGTVSASALQVNGQPYCFLSKTTNQAVADLTAGYVTFDAEVDVTGMHPAGSVTVNILSNGTYKIVGQVSISGNTTGTRQVFIDKNLGTQIARSVVAPFSGGNVVNLSFVGPLVVGDIIRLATLHSSGIELNVLATYTELTVQKLF